MFINSMRGQSIGLTKAIRAVDGVLSADAITGDYDIIASVEVRTGAPRAAPVRSPAGSATATRSTPSN